MPTLKSTYSLASTHQRINKLFNDYVFDCELSDQVKHFSPYNYSKFKPSIRTEKDGNILDIQLLNQHSQFKLTPDLENEFFDILMLECVIDVHRSENNFTVSQNNQIDIICYCNRLQRIAMQGRLEMPCKIDFIDNLSAEKFSSLINALENYPASNWIGLSNGWSLLAAAFLLADVIETNIDLSDKTTEGIDQYWNKRYHDAISFALKAAKFNPDLQVTSHSLLLHIKATTAEYYPDIKQRMDELLFDPNVETYNLFKRDPIKALLQHNGSFFNKTLIQKNTELTSQEEKTLFAKLGNA